MVDLNTVVALHGFADERVPHPSDKYGELIAPGVVHIDYGDPDRVYRITVEEVPRRHLRVPPAAVLVDDIDVHVTGVVVDTHVSVRLEGVGAAAEAAAADHRLLTLDWSADDRAGSGRQAPPPWPAARISSTVRVVLTDDVGTVYDFASSAFGGDDSPWTDLRRYLPAPPPNATALRLRLAVADGTGVEVAIPLART